MKRLVMKGATVGDGGWLRRVHRARGGVVVETLKRCYCGAADELWERPAVDEDTALDLRERLFDDPEGEPGSLFDARTA